MVMPNGKAELKFYSDFQPKTQKKFSAAQVFVDSEVLRLCEPLTPLLTSMLIKSGTLGTVPGQGFVSWIAPYSRKQYYSPRAVGSQTGPQRGPFWFQRMKDTSGKQILDGAQKIAAGESK
jgi:hypothetical protein